MIPGFRVGHVTNLEGLTGCTVILCPPNTLASCDVRGTSPATRETVVLAPERPMAEVHAIVLAGGSAFGLAAADGVMRYLEERDIGYQTPWAKVPIVPAAAIFDFNIGARRARPTADDGYSACVAAREPNDRQGNCGAGTGATVGKWAGAEYRMKGGLGLSSIVRGDAIVECLAVVNAVGDVIDERGEVIAGACTPSGEYLWKHDPVRPIYRPQRMPLANTTLVVVVTNARLTKVHLNRVAQRAQTGMARAIVPVHTSYDGDIVFSLSTGEAEADFDLVAEMAAEATAQSIRSAVRHAATVGDTRGLQE